MHIALLDGTIHAVDKSDGAALRDELRAEHQVYQAGVESLYVTRGPLLGADGGAEIGSLMIIDVADQSRIPFFAEPFFLNFNADCEFRIAMSPEDLGKAGLDKLGEQWG